MPDPVAVLDIVRRATRLFRATPGRRGSIVHLQDADDVLVLGDLHGHLHVLSRAVGIAALENFAGRHLVVQELIHDTRVAPGIAPDLSHRLVDVVCALKCRYPDRVHLVLGNHELAQSTGHAIGKRGIDLNRMFRGGVKASYGSFAPELLEAYSALFRALPIAVRTANRVQICHTIPNGADLETLDLSALDADQWSDAALTRGGAIYALTWGRDLRPETADRFARLMGADFFITGHHPCDHGHHLANHRMLILDGTEPHPTSCLFNATGPIAVEDLLAGVRPVFDCDGG